jgi:hypothetical protein
MNSKMARLTLEAVLTQVDRRRSRGIASGRLQQLGHLRHDHLQALERPHHHLERDDPFVVVPAIMSTPLT